MDQFLGEIRIFPYGFEPKNWLLCSGQILSISTNQALFALLGTAYGGNGSTTFAIPNLSGRTAIHAGTAPATGATYTIGQTGGASNVTLTSSQIPLHTHGAVAAVTASGDSDDPAAGKLAQSTIRSNAYAPSSNATNTAMVGAAGNNLPHNNMPPYLVMGYYIAVAGIFPSRN